MERTNTLWQVWTLTDGFRNTQWGHPKQDVMSWCQTVPLSLFNEDATRKRCISYIFTTINKILRIWDWKTNQCIGFTSAIIHVHVFVSSFSQPPLYIKEKHDKNPLKLLFFFNISQTLLNHCCSYLIVFTWMQTTDCQTQLTKEYG